MKSKELGQSLVETSVLTASISLGVLGLWSICNESVVRFIDLIIAVIASPIP